MSSLITVTDMSCIKMNGIKYIVGFDESCVVLETEKGRIIVEGSGLKVESLEKESGNIVVSGSITGLFLSRPKEQNGLLKKLFK